MATTLLNQVCVFIDEGNIIDYEAIEKLVINLGGSVARTLCQKVTHVISTGENTKSIVKAQKLGKLCVSPKWLYECSTNKKKSFGKFLSCWDKHRFCNKAEIT